MPVLLRMRDLKEYGVNNWPTLGRWIKEEDFPAGFYLAKNTRAWYKDDCDAWLASRPLADPPPEIVKPAPSVGPEGSGRVTNADKHPLDSESAPLVQVPSNGGAAHG